MLVYKIYHNKDFEEKHKSYFQNLLMVLINKNYLSPNIVDIIFTDDLKGEIDKDCSNHNTNQNMISSREYFTGGKIIDINGKKKVYFSAYTVDGNTIIKPLDFYNLILEVHAEDIISTIYKVPIQFTATTPLTEVIKMFFFQWATKLKTIELIESLNTSSEARNDCVKMYVDSFKRNIRKLHYNLQAGITLDEFWIKAITEVDFFIRRCFDVKYDVGSLQNLQEFNEIIPPLLSEIETQTQKLLRKEEIDFIEIRKYVLQILNICNIDIPCETSMYIDIKETPKKLFRNNIVDTEPRIVAFIDILGFSAIIEEYDNDEHSNILNELHETLEMAVKISIERMKDQKVKTDLKEYLEYRMFSDCICLSLPYIEFGNDFHIQFHSLAIIVKSYQLAMMQNGFFVRGGISVGSFYSDKHMIFSGGLVSAHNLEQETVYPVIAIEKKVIERLKLNFSENSKGLFYENILLYSDSEPEKIFLNPFDLLDNSMKYFDYLQSTMDNLIKENEADKDDSLSGLTTSVLKPKNTFNKPNFDYAKSQITPKNMNVVKEKVLEYVNEQLDKYTEISLKYKIDSKEYKDVKKIVVKYEHLKSLTEWSMGIIDSSLFKFYQFM